MSEQWPRAMIRAALREVGYDAVGATTVEEARRYRAIEPGRGAVELIVVDQDLIDENLPELRDIVSSHRDPPVIVLAHATRGPPPGSWTDVLRRPVSVEDVVSAVQTRLPLPEDARRPLEPE